MGKSKHDSRHGSQGFTLIASLLLLVLLSGVAVGLMYMVNGSGKVGGSDMEANVAYYGAESGMEKLTSDLASLYQLELAPTQTDLNTLAQTSPPSSAQISGMTYLESVQWTQTNPDGSPKTGTSIISSGANQGLTAEIIPITLQVTAIRSSGASVNMTRGVQVALIPVFQFGVFSDSDLSYFAGPQFGFKGRVHTNGSLFLAADSGPLILDAKVTAVGQIIRDRLANNFTNGANYQGSVFIPDKTGGCDNFIGGGAQGTDCGDFGLDSNNATDDSSWGGGIPPAGVANGNWNTASTGTFNGMIGNAASIGVQALQLPFVQGATGGTADQQIQIIRKPLPGEAANTPLGASREYNKANIRILLADHQADLRPGSPVNDGQDIDLTTGCTPTVPAVAGMLVSTGFAWADSTQDGAWTGMKPPAAADLCNGKGGETANTWPLFSGWLRVEYKPVGTTTFTAITTEWLKLGFARGIFPPSVPVTTGGAGSNAVNPQAILILQELADRNGDGKINGADKPSTINGNYSWYPINFYDPREGFPRDVALGGTQCYANGIMNAVELDVGNLRQWLLGNAPYNGLSGTKVDPAGENGYLVYFSDRRGMTVNPNAKPTPNVLNGESGLEDVINSGVGTGMPDGIPEPITAGYNNSNGFSPEDVDENGKLDNWGWHNMAEGFGKVTPAGNPYVAVDCLNTGRQNKVAGVRHVLRLVDGTLNNLPTKTDGTGGFTVTAENPVYVLGDYNSNAGDPFWGNQNAADIPHSAAAVIADAVTLLSNNWSDLTDMQNPNAMTNRNGTDTYYRMAIASGKNMNFPQPTGTANDFGTDGGVHNFLRYIEDWGGGPTLYYRGSLISLYYAEYATGIFKCCTMVYSPPNRNYFFDSEFLTPSNLPPGTPELQDINNLTYWQSFSPCTTQAGGACTN
jgi:Tfp pilus assembly protein PilX